MPDKNITIPLSIFNKIIDLIDCWHISDYDPLLRPTYSVVLDALMEKKHSIELRAAYQNILVADSDEQRDEARLRYLMKKRRFDDF
jgi:hypothetical protein